MTRKREWNKLSTGYRKDLIRGGLTKRSYESGASVTAARRHTTSPESAKYRKLADGARVDIRTVIPDYDELTAAERERLAQQWLTGILGKARGPKRPNGKRRPSVAQGNAKNAFLNYLDENVTEIDWKDFREAYGESLAQAA